MKKLEYGYRVCEALDQGMTLDDVIDTAFKNAMNHLNNGVEAQTSYAIAIQSSAIFNQGWRLQQTLFPEKRRY